MSNDAGIKIRELLFVFWPPDAPSPAITQCEHATLATGGINLVSGAGTNWWTP